MASRCGTLDLGQNIQLAEHTVPLGATRTAIRSINSTDYRTPDARAMPKRDTQFRGRSCNFRADDASQLKSKRVPQRTSL
uniref:Uncharacterized protein n=1 Tax=Trichuris muris TaxID=70415 RepID=A0A5S6QDR3_TRIMR